MESVYSKVWVILEPYLLTFRVVIGFVIWFLSLRIFAFRNFGGGCLAHFLLPCSITEGVEPWPSLGIFLVRNLTPRRASIHVT